MFREKVHEKVSSLSKRRSSGDSKRTPSDAYVNHLSVSFDVESDTRQSKSRRPKRKAAVSLTQADLIKEALRTEEINRASLLAFYAAEEDRREADRLYGMRYEIIGPKVTFLSRAEGGGRDWKGKGKVKAEAPLTKAQIKKLEKEKLESGRKRLIQVIGESGKEGWRAELDVAAAATVGAAERQATAKNAQSIDESHQEEPATPAGRSMRSRASPVSQRKGLRDQSSSEREDSPPPIILPTTLPELPAEQEEEYVEVDPADYAHTRNYVILQDYAGATQAEEMEAWFGEHSLWEDFHVVADQDRLPSAFSSRPLVAIVLM